MESEMLKTQKLESVGILAGGIAHDFNNILTVIMGNIFIAKNFIKKNLKKEELLEILSTLEKASVRAKDLTQQLLTFSKGGAPVFKTTSVAEILKESANFALRGSSIKCETSIAKNLWNIEIDEGQISQVINNMVINAKQAINIGGMVTISAENIQITFKESLPIKNGRYIVITINDTGDGIPEEILSKIFDPYFSTKKEGSGLGLASSYSIIKKHKGHIAVKSDVDVGTIFHIYLPASTKDIPVQKKEVKRKHLLQGRILVLEDDEMVKKTTAMMLSETGYETKFASDGKKAVEIYQKAMETGNPFDVVILDLTIPGGMGGEEAMKELRKINPDIKGIACSGYSNSSVMSNYKRYGFSGVLPKPYNTEKLIGVLSKIFI
jgi:CheY-like chemotaxis protein